MSNEGCRFSQTLIREPGFNPHSSHPLDTPLDLDEEDEEEE